MADEALAPLPLPSEQWPERRGFERRCVGNPETPARLLKWLLGLYALYTELGQSHPNSQEFAEGVIVTIRAIIAKYPECLETEYKIDNEAGGGIYSVDPRLLQKINELLGRTDEA